ncbi:hypothetical protein [Roseomonas elaeocarpi]|uniref:Uncharacterized protein n=1 Tax=Roseomonas elaeocarpi TaxID=907779 RepID=A0ABV6JRI1_9PROT
MSRLRTIALSTLLATGLMAASPLGAFAADLQGSVSRFTPGSTPTDNSNATGSIARGGPVYSLGTSHSAAGSTPRDNSNATGSIARGGPVYAMQTSRFTVGSTPLDPTDAGSSAGM